MVYKLYPYQLTDVEELKERPRIILGSVMRSGKMIETFELVKQLNLENILIICPKPMVPEWKWNLKEQLTSEYWDRFDILNYEKLRAPELVNVIDQVGYDLIVFDECQRIKNRKAQQTKGAFLIGGSSTRVILASGTPFENGPHELWPLLHIIDPSSFKSFWAFADEYCYIEQLPMPPYPRIIKGPKNKQKLKELLQQYMLRRERDEVRDHDGKLLLPERPPARTMPVQLEDEQLEKYLTMEEELFAFLDSGEKITVCKEEKYPQCNKCKEEDKGPIKGCPERLAQILRLRQICLEPNLLSQDHKTSTPAAKTKVLVELLGGMDEPALIYTYFEKYARILGEELERNKISHVLYTGTTDPNLKLQIRQDAQAKKYQAVIMTIKMGLGITLNALHDVIFTDLWWNGAVNDQAIARAEGAGEVQVTDLWALDTIEDAMHRILERKQKVFNEAVAVDESIKELRQLKEIRK